MATLFKNYQEDPDLGDENDPAYKEEMFRFFQIRGWTPEDLKDKTYAEEYGKWLQSHTS